MNLKKPNTLCFIYNSSVSSLLPFASSNVSNQLTLPTLLWIRLCKFTTYAEMQSRGFGLCYHREEIPFWLKTTALRGVGGLTGLEGNGRWTMLQFHLCFRPVLHLHCCQKKWFSPTSLPILAQFVSTQQNGSRNYCKLDFTGGRVFLTWNSSLTPLTMQRYKPFLPVQGRGKLSCRTCRFMPA